MYIEYIHIEKNYTLKPKTKPNAYLNACITTPIKTYMTEWIHFYMQIMRYFSKLHSYAPHDSFKYVQHEKNTLECAYDVICHLDSAMR
jgi:hypothetical protein